ncbi:hypothetical protein ACWD01_18970 [Streptomyces sp. NPDC002835]
MEYTHLSAELVADEEFTGFELFAHDAWQARDRANWLVAKTPEEIVVGRVGEASSSDLFAGRYRWPFAQAADARVFATPLPDGGLAVSADGVVTTFEADGRVRWTHEHQPWFDQRIAAGACAADSAGRLLLVTMIGHTEGGGSYEGDLCVALDLANGRRVTHTVLPSASAGYAFQQALTDPAQLFLNAAQGDTFHSLLVSVEHDRITAEHVGFEDEPFAGLSMNGAFLKMDVGGEWLSRYETGRPDVSVDAEDVLPEGLRFVGYRPGFLDPDRVLTAVAADQDSADNRHLVLDGRTLQPVAEIEYAGTKCSDPLALGDGTWLTVEGTSIRRWRTA